MHSHPVGMYSLHLFVFSSFTQQDGPPDESGNTQGVSFLNGSFILATAAYLRIRLGFCKVPRDRNRHYK